MLLRPVSKVEYTDLLAELRIAQEDLINDRKLDYLLMAVVFYLSGTVNKYSSISQLVLKTLNDELDGNVIFSTPWENDISMPHCL